MAVYINAKPLQEFVNNVNYIITDINFLSNDYDMAIFYVSNEITNFEQSINKISNYTFNFWEDFSKY